jgi:hypothetical protein
LSHFREGKTPDNEVRWFKFLVGGSACEARGCAVQKTNHHLASRAYRIRMSSARGTIWGWETKIYCERRWPNSERHQPKLEVTTTLYLQCRGLNWESVCFVASYSPDSWDCEVGNFTWNLLMIMKYEKWKVKSPWRFLFSETRCGAYSALSVIGASKRATSLVSALCIFTYLRK